MVVTPFWSTVTPALQVIAVLMGIAWIGMQMYYKVKNERKKDH